MSLLGNILWFIFGGLLTGLAWWFFGALAFITIVGIPFAKSCFVIGSFAFLPFGKVAISRETLTGKEDIGTGALGLVGNIIWFIFAGLWIAIAHIACAAACAITIIGIPFAWQHVKLAALTLSPIGKTIVPAAVARQAEDRSAAEYVNKMRS